MLTEDYIMRMISQALAVIMTALGLKKAGKYKEALQSFEQAVETLLGLDAMLVDQLDDTAILDMLTFHDRLDTERVLVLADIYREQAELYELQGNAGHAQLAAIRSLRLYLETVLSNDTIPSTELIQQIEFLRKKIAVSSLPDETCLALLDYFDRLLGAEDEFLVSAGISRTVIQAYYSNLTTHCPTSQVNFDPDDTFSI